MLHFEKTNCFANENINIGWAKINKKFPVHTHDFYEIVIITDGSGEHIIENNQYPIKKGDTFVIKGKISHGFVSVSDLEMINIMYTPSIFSANNHLLHSIPGFMPLFVIEPTIRINTHFSDMLTLTEIQLEHIKQFANLLKKLLINADEASLFSGQFLFFAIVSYISAKYETKTKYFKNIKLLADVIKFMDENLNKPLQMSDLTQSVFISSRHLNRLFEKYYHEPPISYLKKMKLEKAYDLLRNTTYNISEIAYECGFSDNSYFSRVFKENFGYTPTQIKKIASHKY